MDGQDFNIQVIMLHDKHLSFDHQSIIVRIKFNFVFL